MKKLYRSKCTVHPSPPIISDHLSFLPATILTLAAALSPEDREVLAYLIACNRRNSIVQRANFYPKNMGNDHPPSFNCDCFSCYMSYWIRWDSSPNRQLIHEIIDAFEDGLSLQRKTHNKNKKERKRKGNNGLAELKRSESKTNDKVAESESQEESSGSRGGGDDGVGGDKFEAEGSEKGSVRRFMSFIGERIWGVYG